MQFANKGPVRGKVEGQRAALEWRVIPAWSRHKYSLKDWYGPKPRYGLVHGSGPYVSGNADKGEKYGPARRAF